MSTISYLYVIEMRNIHFLRGDFYFLRDLWVSSLRLVVGLIAADTGLLTKFSLRSMFRVKMRRTIRYRTNIHGRNRQYTGMYTLKLGVYFSSKCPCGGGVRPLSTLSNQVSTPPKSIPLKIVLKIGQLYI